MSVSLKQSYDIEYDGTANVARMDLFVDTAADLTGLTTFDSIVLLAGSSALDISTGDLYRMQSDGTWILQPGTGAFYNVYTKAEIDAMIANYYTKTEADDLFVWITVTITTDTLPLSFISDGTPLTSVTIKGNGQQSGTPSPQNIVPFDGTGDRMANLFNYVSYFDSTFTNYNEFFDYADLQLSANTTYTLSTSYTEVGTNPRNTSFIVAKPSDTPTTASGGISSTSPITITTGSDGKLRLYKRIFGTSEHPTKSQFDNGEWLMLNTGSTALPYEPYGYKIPLTNASVTTPLYLGEVSTVRRIKKMILDGTETVTEESANVYSIPISDTVIAGAGVSTHFAYDASMADGQFQIESGKAVFGYDDTLENFKAFLSSEYAAGHSVAVWYVLAEPETGIVNEPLAKIGDYADELSSTDTGVSIPTAKGSNTLTVDTTLQPSEMTITGKIRNV